MNDTRLYWIHALTPLHVGAGRGVGYIDLPIMREKVSGWPLVPGSAVKGVLADHHRVTDDRRITDAKIGAAFGRSGDDSANAGSLVFSDARLVCLPVRSLYGTFAWCTSPLALRRLARDLGAAAVANIPQLPDAPPPDTVLLSTTSVLREGQAVYFEDLDFTGTPTPAVEEWAKFLAAGAFIGAWRGEFISRFACVSDDVFNFLSSTATEVNARIRLEPGTKTVIDGALWYEEALPAETLLAGLAWCDRVFGRSGITAASLLDEFCAGELALQIGGKASVGKGRVRCVFSPSEAREGASRA